MKMRVTMKRLEAGGYWIEVLIDGQWMRVARVREHRPPIGVGLAVARIQLAIDGAVRDALKARQAKP